MPACHPLLNLHIYGLMAMFSAATVAEQPVQNDQPASLTIQNLAAALQYESAMSTYQSYSDQPVQSWHDANERVRSIGGWRTYAREAAADEAVPDSVPPSHHQHDDGEAQP